MRQLLWLIVIVSAFAPTSTFPQILTGLEPRTAKENDIVSILGIGFDPQIDYSVRIGEIPAAVVSITENEIRFSVSAETSTGDVEIHWADGSLTYRPSLTVLREVPVTLDPALVFRQQPVAVGTMFGDAAGQGPMYLVDAAKGVSGIVFASDVDDGLTYSAIVTDFMQDIVIGAESTALSLLFLNAFVYAADPDEADQRLAVLKSLPETAALEERIQTNLSQGTDYLLDPLLNGLVVDGVMAFLNTPQSSSTPRENIASGASGENRSTAKPFQKADLAGGPLSIASGFPRDLFVRGYTLLNRIDTSGTPARNNSSGMSTVGIEFSSRPIAGLDFLPDNVRQYFGANSLDALANVYELSPTPFADGLQSVLALEGSYSEVYARNRLEPVTRVSIPAELATRFLDVIGLIKDQLFQIMYPSLDESVEARIPADRPGVYMIRTFSGARFSPQEQLIENLPGGFYEDRKMLILNTILAAHDAIGFVLQAFDILEDRDLAEISMAMYAAVSQAMEREAVLGTLDGHVVLVIFSEAGETLLHELLGKIVDAAIERGLSIRAFSGGGRILQRGLAVYGIIVSGAQILERVMALSNVVNFISPRAYMAHAIQSSVVVVGNPWAPQIEYFTPQEAHRGTLIVLHGSNFSRTDEENIVVFGRFSTDPENPPEPIRAEVVDANSHSLLVRVPEGAESGPINVTILGKGSSSTAGLDPPFHEFTVLPDPEIIAMEPNPPIAGQLARVTGRYFASDYLVNRVAFGTGGGSVLAGNRSELLIRIPNSLNPNSMTVSVSGRASNTFEFTPILPPQPTGTSTIRVTSLADNNTRDGEITLREAFLLAIGELDVTQLTMPPPGDREFGVTYETDYVQGVPGTASEDFITVEGGVGADVTFELSDPLPGMGSWDQIVSRCTIDGQGMDADGLVLDGVRQVSLKDLTIRNFAKNGIHITGSAFSNTLENVTVMECGGDGYLLDGEATINQLIDIHADANNGNGIHLSGPGVQLNDIGRDLPYISNIGSLNENEAWGLLVDNGARFNRMNVNSVQRNGSGGVRVSGSETIYNLLIGLRQSHSQDEPSYAEIFDNAGPGVMIDAPYTTVEQINPAGNEGDGILIESVDAHDVNVRDCRIGYATVGEVSRPNRGSGIHIRDGAQDVLVGTLRDGDRVTRNQIGGNDFYGIQIEGDGTGPIQINHTDIGFVSRLFVIFDDDPRVVVPNGQGGIALMNGAQNVTVGDVDSDRRVVITDHANGAGILMSGQGTQNNRVLGCTIGMDARFGAGHGNQYGIRLTDGARDNWIGISNERLNGVGGVDESSDFDARNQIVSSLEAGILLESGGGIDGTFDPTQPPPTPQGSNVIQYNLIGNNVGNVVLGNHVGILIKPGGVANLIQQNSFYYNDRAGLEIADFPIAPVLSNRIISNYFWRQGSGVTDFGDPLIGVPNGVGLAITGNSANHHIGELSGGANTFNDNQVGIYIENSSNIQIQNQFVGSGYFIKGNAMVGMVLRDCANCEIGPNVTVFDNGIGAGALGGVVIRGGGGHRVFDSWIGTRSVETESLGNTPNGIAIYNSSSNLLRNNVVVGNRESGILIEGAGSTDNHLAHNHIGVGTIPGRLNAPNGMYGVLIRDGASHNRVGDLLAVQIGSVLRPVPAPNVIAGNGQDGVHVEGAGAVGNTITYNSIYDHNNGRGIRNLNGGNDELPAPHITNVLRGRVLGSVESDRVPDGSRVQVFSDPLNQGREFLGETTVAGGFFEAAIRMPLYTRITATVTHGSNGNTSEFAVAAVFEAEYGLQLSRAGAPPSVTSAPLGGTPLVLGIHLKTGESDVFIDRIRFHISGSSAPESRIDNILLYRDVDADGQLGLDDSFLAQSPRFVDESMRILELGVGTSVAANTDERWLVMLSLSEDGVEGESIALEIQGADSVDSRIFRPGFPITETGLFPIRSDEITLRGASTSVKDWELR